MLLSQNLSMKFMAFFFLLTACAQTPSRQPKDLVSLDAALNQAQASYLKGCVMALKELKIPAVFTGCRDKAILHRQELDLIMNQDL